MSKTYEFKVGMTCDGCKGAITRILGKVEGVQVVTCDVDSKQLLVKSANGHQVVADSLAKWSAAAGKSVEYVGEKAA